MWEERAINREWSPHQLIGLCKSWQLALQAWPLPLMEQMLGKVVKSEGKSFLDVHWRL